METTTERDFTAERDRLADELHRWGRFLDPGIAKDDEENLEREVFRMIERTSEYIEGLEGADLEMTNVEAGELQALVDLIEGKATARLRQVAPKIREIADGLQRLSDAIIEGDQQPTP